MLEWIKKKLKNEETDNFEKRSEENKKSDINEKDEEKPEQIGSIENEELNNESILEECTPRNDKELSEKDVQKININGDVENKEIATRSLDSMSEESKTDSLDIKESIDKEKEEGKEVQEDKSVENISFFQRLKKGLTKTRDTMGEKINDILGNYVKIDEEMLEDLEDLLISADMGMETTMYLIDALRERIRKEKIQDPALVKNLLSEEIEKMLIEKSGDPSLDIEPGPAVLLIVGVNGVGKTTTIGKITQQLKNDGKSVLIAAGDTFRAAAIEQLKTWGQRSNTDVIAHQEGADPAAVIYDAIQAAKSRKIDVLICDTAGRLHNKKNLMNELEKIHRIISREYEGAKKEVLLVLDATTGQNAILQAKTFDEVTNLTGIVLTKLDGTAKGGVVLPLVNQLKIPIKFIGIGEGIDDLQKFNSSEFSKALMGIE